MVRNTLPGEKHFCASALIISQESPKKIVLLHHKKTGMWMQPGGHIENMENPVEAVIREVKEETGLDITFFFQKIRKIDDFASELPVPDFLYEEPIPARKDEPAHFHLDFLYKIELPFQELKVQEEESHAIGWFTLEEALQLPMYENSKELLQKVLTE